MKQWTAWLVAMGMAIACGGSIDSATVENDGGVFRLVQMSHLHASKPLFPGFVHPTLDGNAVGGRLVDR